MRALLLLIFAAGLAGAPAKADDAAFVAARRRTQVAHEKILQEHPASVSAHLAYAEFLSENGNLRTAIVHWRQAQRLDPGNAATANSLGGAYLRVGHAAESAEQFSRAIELASENAAYHFNLANVEFMLRHDLEAAWNLETPEMLRRALAEFRAASRLAPNDLEYARAYAETFYGVPNPDWAEAETAWKHVLALSSQGDFAYLQLARISLKRGNAREARRCLAKLTDTRNEGLKRKLLAQADRL
jgi:tetratricopeptide (TPR) repeat protein